MTKADRRLAAGALVTMSLLAACGGAAATPTAVPSQTAAASASPTNSPQPVAVTIAVEKNDARTVLFLRADGTTLGQTDLQSAEDVTSAAGKLWYIGAGDGHLRTVGVDGSRSDVGFLEGLATPGSTTSGLAVSGDGSRWAWGCLSCNSSAPRTRLYVGGAGIRAHIVLDEPTSNWGLVPLAWTASGLIVARQATGLGGCCYLTPEIGHMDAMLVDSATLQVSATWSGCSTASASQKGAFACVSASLTVHLPDGSTRMVSPTPPVAGVGWGHVDDAGNRVVFAVIHSRAGGEGVCPCVIDTETAALDTGVVTKLADQMTPDGLLSNGRVIASSAPLLPGQGTFSEWLLSADGTRVQLGPNGAHFVAIVSPS